MLSGVHERPGGAVGGQGGPDVLLCHQTDIEITREEDFTRILQMEEEYIQQLCEDIIHVKPDVVITEKGISGRGAGRLLLACGRSPSMTNGTASAR